MPVRKFIVVADRIYTLNAIKYLKQNDLLAGVINSYASPVKSYAKYLNIPSYNIHTLSDPEVDEHGTFDRNSFLLDELSKTDIKILNLGSQIPPTIENSIENFSENSINLNVCQFSGDLAFEKALIYPEETKNSEQTDEFYHDFSDSTGKHEINFSLSNTNIQATKTIQKASMLSLETQNVITELADSLEEMVSTNIEELRCDDSLKVKLEKSENIAREIQTDILPSEIMYMPYTDSSYELFFKIVAFYGFYQVLGLTSAIQMQHKYHEQYVDVNQMMRPVYLTDIKLIPKVISDFLTEEFRSDIDAKYTKETTADIKLSPAGIPIGYFIIMPNFPRSIPKQLYEQYNGTRESLHHRRVYIHMSDGAWVQLLAYSFNGIKTMSYDQFGLMAKSNIIPFEYRRFYQIKNPRERLSNEMMNRMLLVGTNTLDGTKPHRSPVATPAENMLEKDMYIQVQAALETKIAREAENNYVESKTLW